MVMMVMTSTTGVVAGDGGAPGGAFGGSIGVGDGGGSVGGAGGVGGAFGSGMGLFGKGGRAGSGDGGGGGGGGTDGGGDEVTKSSGARQAGLVAHAYCHATRPHAIQNSEAASQHAHNFALQQEVDLRSSGSLLLPIGEPPCVLCALLCVCLLR